MPLAYARVVCVYVCDMIGLDRAQNSNWDTFQNSLIKL